MRLPNLSSSNAITSKIRELDQQRFKIDRQISSGQKLRLPEDDGMRMGRIIRLETQKGQLTQYQRNASYAEEFLNAGQLNLDKLTELNQRAQEIARSAGSSLNGPAMETYGHEINQLIEEALNRINSTHRKQALFGGTKLKPKFASSDVLLGKRQTEAFSFNEVGQPGADGKRRIGFGDEMIFALNGREYVFQSKVDGMDTEDVAAKVRDLINNESGILGDSLSYETTEYKAFVRGAVSSDSRYNSRVEPKAMVSVTGNLVVTGAVGQTYEAKSTLLTHWDPNFYLPEQFDRKLKQETAFRHPGVPYEELSQTEKEIVQEAVKGVPADLSKALDDETAKQFPSATYPGISSYSDLTNTQKLTVYKAVVKNNWSRDLTVTSKLGDGASTIAAKHSQDWRRLTIYQQGEVVRFGGKTYESVGSHNVNHAPLKSGADYWRELNSGYDTEREDWDLEVTGTENRYYWVGPDGKLFADQTSAVSHAQNLLWAAKKTEYTLMDDPSTPDDEGVIQLNLDVANNVRQVAIPVNEFSVTGSENEGAVFFDSETFDYRLVASAEGGVVINGPYVKGNLQLFKPDDPLIQAKDVVLHEGRYFLVNDPTGIDKENMSKIVENFPPSGVVVNYNGQEQKVLTGQGTQLALGQYIFDPSTSQYYVANQKVDYTAQELQAAILNAESVATAVGNQSQSLSMPVDPSAFKAYSSTPYSAGEIISPDGLVTKVATNQMRGTFDPKKLYNSKTDINAIDPQTGTTPSLPHVVYGGVNGGAGSYFQFTRDHLGEWEAGGTVGQYETAYKDGQLWQAGANLSSVQNTEANFNANWTSLGSVATVQQLANAPISNATDVSAAVETEAITIPVSGATGTSKFFQDTVFNVQPIAGLDKVASGPSSVTATQGQYLHDTTSGEYFLAKGDIAIDLASASYSAGNLSTSALNLVSLTERSDGKVFLLGGDLPTEGKELAHFSDHALVAKAGDYVYDPVTKDYYVALQGVSKPATWAEGKPFSSGDLVKYTDNRLYSATKNLNGTQNTAANFSTNWDLASTWVGGVAVNSGDSVYKDGDLYTSKQDLTATENSSAPLASNTFWTKTNGVPDYTLPLADDATSPYFSRIGSQQGNGPHGSQQGEDWMSSRIYDYGQIVHYQGSYYRCLAHAFNNEITATTDGNRQAHVITPGDALIPSDNALYPNAMVANDKWGKIEEPLNHVMKFSVQNSDRPVVTIKSAGSTGVDAKAEAIVDAYGQVVGLKIVDPGRYFFGTSLGGPLPPDFQLAKVILSDGQEMEAEILWGQNPKDPGPYGVTGFNLSQSAALTGASAPAQAGDTFSFATGSKTFLDHRDGNGDVVSITYTGSKKNSVHYVGNESKISGFLSAKNEGTKELGDAVQTIVELRESLANAIPSHYSQEVENAEKDLIAQEESLINKMGELSSRMVRMNTVRAHDEDYFMQLDQRISKDVDIDLSEAIMRLTRISTAYQASLQVGSQLLNTSLLNYL